MSNTPRKLTRNQLAEFLPNARAVRAFEQLLDQVGNLLPDDIVTINRLIQEVNIDAGTASAAAVQALAAVDVVSQLLDLIATAPPSADLQDLVKAIEALAVLPPQTPPTLGVLQDVSTATPVAGSLLIYDATQKIWRKATLTNGSNISITNADGSVTVAATGLEPTITAGTTAQFWRGDKTWQDFATNVRSTVLTGLSTATNAVITAADTVLSALGKLQKQISDNLTTLTTHTGASTGVHGVTGAVVGTTDSQNVTNKNIDNSPIGATTKSTGAFTKITHLGGTGNNLSAGTYDIAVDDYSGGIIHITAVQGGVGTSYQAIPFAKRAGTLVLGTSLPAVITANPIGSITVSSGNVRLAITFNNTYVSYAIQLLPTAA